MAAKCLDKRPKTSWATEQTDGRMCRTLAAQVSKSSLSSNGSNVEFKRLNIQPPNLIAFVYTYMY